MLRLLCVMSAVLCGAGMALASPTDPSVMDLHLFSNSTGRGAVCNDGTPSGFYFKRSTTGSDTWLVTLDGGFWCWDTPSCSYRWKNQNALTSSSGWPQQRGLGGIFSQNPDLNPQFHDANMVFVQYCTSDAFVGNTGPSRTGDPADPSTWHYRGLAVLRAAVEDMRALGMSASSTVVYSGCSAGGQGVVATKDRFAEMLRSVGGLTGAGARVFAVADAGWMMDEQPVLGSKNTPIAETFKAGMRLWDGVVDSRCAADHATEPWQCLFTPVAVRYFNDTLAPTLIQSNQDDQFQVPWNLGANPPYDAEQLAWINSEYAPHMRATMEEFITKPPNGAFSAACFAHCYTYGDLFWSVTVQGTSMRDAVAALTGAQPGQITAIATGLFNTSAGCPAN